MLATSLRELWRSSIWYLTTWDEKTFWIFPLKDILKKHSVIQRLHQITKKPFLNIRFSGLCSLAGFWADRASAEPFLSFPPSPLFLSVCVRAEETLRGAEWPPSLVRMKNRSAARQNQSWHTTLHDTDAQAVLFFLSRPGPILFLLELVIDHFTDEHVYVPNTGAVFYNVGKCFSRFFFFFKWCKNNGWNHQQFTRRRFINLVCQKKWLSVT